MQDEVTCIILDDEPFAVRLLKDYADKISFLKVITAGSDVYEAMDILKNHSVDIIFLDIQMPELTGIEFMQSLRKDQNFIITTAYQEYALESFNFNVIDFLLKPISFQRFYKSLEKLQQWKNQFIEAEKSEDIFVKADRKIYRVALDAIIYIEGMRDYIRIHTEEEKIVVYENMKDILKKLPTHGFLRIHRSYIVSLKKIKLLDGNILILKNSIQLPIGETYRKKIKDYFETEL